MSQGSHVNVKNHFFLKTISLSILLVLTINIQNSAAQIESRWIGNDGNWSNPSNWDNGVPNGNFTAIIDGVAGQITQDLASASVVNFELNDESGQIVLDHDLVILNELDWQTGEIGGQESVLFFGTGQIVNVKLETTFDNNGFVSLGANGAFGSIVGESTSTWNNQQGSVLELPNGGQFGSFVGNGDGELNISFNSIVFFEGSSISVNWAVNNEGTIEINNTIALFLDDYQQTSSANLILNDGGADFFQESAIQGRVSGNGTISNLADSGFEAELTPGGTAIGTIGVAGGLLMTPVTISNFQIGPGLSSDTVTNIGGPLQLDGTLNIEALPGATTGIYTLFTYNNSFMLQTDNIQLGKVPDGFSGSLFLDTTSQSIKLDVQTLTPVVLLGDVNQDGNVDLLDVAEFVALVSSGEFQAEADINQDGSVNLLDVEGFIALLAG